nr:uncharacterized protein LOC129386466 [Dermacentor andersoni]
MADQVSLSSRGMLATFLSRVAVSPSSRENEAALPELPAGPVRLSAITSIGAKFVVTKLQVAISLCMLGLSHTVSAAEEAIFGASGTPVPAAVPDTHEPQECSAADHGDPDAQARRRQAAVVHEERMTRRPWLDWGIPTLYVICVSILSVMISKWSN